MSLKENGHYTIIEGTSLVCNTILIVESATSEDKINDRYNVCNDFKSAELNRKLEHFIGKQNFKNNEEFNSR